MRGSITFEFGEYPNEDRIRICKRGDLDNHDLEVVFGLLYGDIMLQRANEAGEIAGTSSDPTGRRQLHNRWIN